MNGVLTYSMGYNKDSFVLLPFSFSTENIFLLGKEIGLRFPTSSPRCPSIPKCSFIAFSVACGSIFPITISEAFCGVYHFS